MRTIYTACCWLVAAGVFVQAAAIALGFGGMAAFVQGGGVVDKALVESHTLGSFTGDVAFPVHGLVGGLVLPVIALLLLGVAFFVKVPRARVWGAAVFAFVVLQGQLGFLICSHQWGCRLRWRGIAP